MSKQTKIIIGIGIAVIALLAIGYYIRKRNADGKVQTVTPETIPEAVQRELAFHDEGEGFSYQGVKYIKQNGAWKVVV